MAADRGLDSATTGLPLRQIPADVLTRHPSATGIMGRSRYELVSRRKGRSHDARGRADLCAVWIAFNGLPRNEGYNNSKLEW